MNNGSIQKGNNHEQAHNLGIVLVYHRVIKLDYDPRSMGVSPEHFEEHVRIIRKYGDPVQMRELAVNLHREPSDKPEIVITLDDGYSDNFRHAKPILDQYDMPATFFIISGAIGSREEFFRDGLEQIILAPTSLPEHLDIALRGQKYVWRIKPESPCPVVDYADNIDKLPEADAALSRSRLYRCLTPALSVLTFKEQKEALSKLADWAGVKLSTRLDYLPMTEHELTVLARNSLFEIGAHTVHHPFLSKLPAEAQEREIGDCKQELERMTGRQIDSFSYPHGDYGPETVSITERLKYRSACTVRARPVRHNTNPYLLPRFMVSDWGGHEFESRFKKWLLCDAE